MTTHPINMDMLISHRFRGFAPYENTLVGFKAALSFGVLLLEFDVRVAACGTPMIYHDEQAKDAQGQRQVLSDYKASEYAKLGGTFAHMPTLEALLDAAQAHTNQDARLLIDIKDLGFEEAIHALVMERRLQSRTVYVSWLPDVLYRLHKMAPQIPKYFSHWCLSEATKTVKNHQIHVSKDGNIPPTSSEYIIGAVSGWAVTAPLQGEMLAMLTQSTGGVCVPQYMLTRALSDYYHRHNLFVSTFGYTQMEKITAHKSTLDVDMYFVDNKEIFEQI